MTEVDPPLKFNVQNLALWSIILVALLTFLIVAKPLLIPLAIAFLMWALLDAIREYLLQRATGRIQLTRTMATLIAILIVILGNWAVLAIVASQVEALSEALPVYQEKFAVLVTKLTQMLGINELPSVANMLEKLDVGAAVSWVGSAFGGVIGNFGLIAIYLGFILAEEKTMTEKLSHLSSNPEKSARLVKLSSEINSRIQLYIGMKTVISALTGLLGYLLLWLVGVDFAALWGLLIFLLNFIPNIGSMLGVIFPALLTLFQFEGITAFVIVTAGLVAINFVIGNILEPAYMGSSLNLSPLMILLSLSVWGAIWGLPGMFLSVPLMVVTAIICAHFEGLRWLAVMLSADGRLATAEA